MSGNRANGIASPPPPPENQNKTVEVYFGVFFDGTLNHLEQASIGERYRKKVVSGLSSKAAEKELNEELEKEGNDKKYTGSDAQENDRSNVALLFQYFNEKSKDYVCRLYLEGIGTEEDGGESLLGKALGKGGTGIKAKVKKAIEKIPEKINEKLANLEDEDINIKLYFELFGFSRGAAAARNFVWNVIAKSTAALTKELKPMKLIFVGINYVGLFDTVSAHGLNLFSDSDVADLHLNAISKAKYVFHICAADEFRKNFALTNIYSAKVAGKGEEIFIPGAHSDIGGGYAAGEYTVILDMDLFPDKTVDDIHTVVTKDSLERLGWIRDTDIPFKNYEIYPKQSRYGDRIKFTNIIQKGYSFIGLELMAEDARSNRTNMFSSIRQQYTTPIQLQEIKELANGSTSLEICQQKFVDHYKSLNLRKYWLHFSSNDAKIGMGPRRKNGILKRNIIDG